ELEPGQRTVGVGEEHLIHAQADLFTDDRLAGDEVTLDQLLSEGLAHYSTWGGASAAPPPSPPPARRRVVPASPAGSLRAPRRPCRRDGQSPSTVASSPRRRWRSARRWRPRRSPSASASPPRRRRRAAVP